MATGRHGVHFDNKLRARESDIEVSRKKELYQDRFRDSGDGRGRVLRDLRNRDSVMVRHRDPKERETSNGTYRSSSSTSNSSDGSGDRSKEKKGRLQGRLVDREPGELSSGSGSDDPDASQSKMKDNGVQRLENGVSSQPTRKRKFSPIVWDRDDDKQSTVVPPRGESGSSVNVPLPPPPPMPEGFVPSSSMVMVGHPEDSTPVNSKVSLASQQDQHLSNDREPGQVEEEEEEEYVPARNISASRWADGDNFPDDDEDKDFNEENGAKRRKSTPVTSSAASGFCKKVQTPELGEVSMREGSEGAASRPSGSGGEDDCREADVDGNDYMEVDREDADQNISDQSDTDNDEDVNVVRTPEQVHPPQRSINMLQGCRSVDEFERLNKIDEGTYGVVYRAKDKKTGEVVALKKVKMEKEREGFPLTSLREINILLSFHHPSIVDVKEVVVGSSLDSIFMVMEYMEHDLKGLMETMKQPFSQSEVKCLMLQLLEGTKYLHDNWVLHRDLKSSNLLFNNRGELKICDFGLSRQYGSPLKPYTHLVVTLWYRAPELLLGVKEYSTAIDMWSLGCIMAELLAKEPLFNGKTEFDQLDKIFRILGTPNEKIWPGFTKLPGVKVNFVKQPYNRLREKFPPTSFSGRPTLSEKGFDLLNKLLTYDPDKRITAEEALRHEWFTEVPLPKSKDFMPTFPAQHAQDRRLRRVLKSPDPLEEQRRKELQGVIPTGSLFG